MDERERRRQLGETVFITGQCRHTFIVAQGCLVAGWPLQWQGALCRLTACRCA